MTSSIAISKLQCLEKFQKDNETEYLTFISSKAILEDPTTISTLVSQNFSVLTAKLSTNEAPSLIEYNCQFGWNRSIKDLTPFQTENQSIRVFSIQNI